MSLGIYGSSGTPQLYIMTTRRTLKLLYFDGQAAALTYWGTLDSQMVLLQNGVPDNLSEHLVFDEGQRAIDLCGLVQELQLDGIARMNAGFEVLLCDYAAAGVELSFSSNVTVPGNTEREQDPTLPRDPNRVPPFGFGNEFAPQSSWEWIRSGTWHYGISGTDAGSTKETRIDLDFCGLITYYDPYLRSLSGHHGRGPREGEIYQNGWGLRKGHRLLGISHKDINTVKKWVKQISSAVTSGQKHCSGIKWQALTETIANQHRTRAMEISATIKDATRHPDKVYDAVKKAHGLTHAILYAYLQYPVAVGVSASVAKDITIARCSGLYTDHIDDKKLNEFEKTIKESIMVVMQEVCSWEWDLFEVCDRHMTNKFDPENQLNPSYHESRDIESDFKHISEATEKIMGWLGWNDWHDCGRKCDYNVCLPRPTCSSINLLHTGVMLHPYVARYLCSRQTSGWVLCRRVLYSRRDI